MTLMWRFVPVALAASASLPKIPVEQIFAKFLINYLSGCSSVARRIAAEAEQRRLHSADNVYARVEDLWGAMRNVFDASREIGTPDDEQRFQNAVTAASITSRLAWEASTACWAKILGDELKSLPSSESLKGRIFKLMMEEAISLKFVTSSIEADLS